MGMWLKEARALTTHVPLVTSQRVAVRLIPHFLEVEPVGGVKRSFGSFLGEFTGRTETLMIVVCSKEVNLAESATHDLLC